MPDQVKDFQYYAAKAESTLKRVQGMSPVGIEAWASVAAVYARLAAAAPKSEPKVDDNHAQFFYYLTNGQRVEGERCPAQLYGEIYQHKLCIHRVGHEKLHETEAGLFFDDY